jgi:putative transposase
MDDVLDVIHTTRDARELKRALAVRKTLAGRLRAEVAAELGCSVSFVDKWRWIYDRQGAAGLRLGYQGSSGYLTASRKQAICEWLNEQSSWDIRALQAHVEQTYGVCYKSAKSYYALMAQARLSWKKTSDVSPKSDPEEIEQTRAVIKKNA